MENFVSGSHPSTVLAIITSVVGTSSEAAKHFPWETCRHTLCLLSSAMQEEIYPRNHGPYLQVWVKCLSQLFLPGTSQTLFSAQKHMMNNGFAAYYHLLSHFGVNPNEKTPTVVCEGAELSYFQARARFAASRCDKSRWRINRVAAQFIPTKTVFQISSKIWSLKIIWIWVWCLSKTGQHYWSCDLAQKQVRWSRVLCLSLPRIMALICAVFFESCHCTSVRCLRRGGIFPICPGWKGVSQGGPQLTLEVLCYELL